MYYYNDEFSSKFFKIFHNNFNLYYSFTQINSLTFDISHIAFAHIYIKSDVINNELSKNWSEVPRRNFDEISHAYNAFKCVPRASTHSVMRWEKTCVPVTYTRTYGDVIYCNIFKREYVALTSGPTPAIEKRLLGVLFFFRAMSMCASTERNIARGRCVPCKATEKEEKIRLPLLLTPRVRQIRMQM